MPLYPTSRKLLLESRGDSFDTVREFAEQLAEQTEAIRIIPAPRSASRMSSESPQVVEGSRNRSAGAPSVETAATEWSRPRGDVVTGDRRPAQFKSRQSDESFDAAGAATKSNQQTEGAVGSQTREAFDLAALVGSPEFREIHTAAVLEGLHLLCDPVSKRRALGAMRIGEARREARTALPVLRKTLTGETDKLVRLRIAEAILKIQPSDPGAADCLGELLSDRGDWQLRQAAAGAFSPAAPVGNAVAVACLTEALDDAHPRVRTVAALTLGQFETAARGAVSRLQFAAANDVPRVRKAAEAALACIAGKTIVSRVDKSPAEPWPGEDEAALPEQPVSRREVKPVTKSLEQPPILDVPVVGPPTVGRSSTPMTPNTANADPFASLPTADPLPSAPRRISRVVRPLRLSPSQHHPLPGKPSQATASTGPMPFPESSTAAKEIPKP